MALRCCHCKFRPAPMPSGAPPNVSQVEEPDFQGLDDAWSETRQNLASYTEVLVYWTSGLAVKFANALINRCILVSARNFSTWHVACKRICLQTGASGSG